MGECHPGGGEDLRDPSPYLCEFKRKTRKTPNGYKQPRIESGTSGLLLWRAEPHGQGGGGGVDSSCVNP